MFIEIKDPDMILEYADSGLLYDSYYIHNTSTGDMEWDGPLHVNNQERGEDIREVLRHATAYKYKFYIRIEE